MKNQKSKFISIYSVIFLLFMQASYAESEFYNTDYGAMAYIIVPFGGGDANTSPILGLTGSKVEFNEIQAALGNKGSVNGPFIHKRNLVDIMYNWEEKRLSRFNLGGVNALDSGILNVDGTGGIKPVAVLIGAGLAVGGIVLAAEAGGGDDDNHVCEEHHEEEEEHHDEFTYGDFDIINNIHPCPEEGVVEEEEGGHGH